VAIVVIVIVVGLGVKSILKVFEFIMETISIDINCDVGEGIGNEASIFPYISSCNIACGGHTGTMESMREIVLLAKKHKVKLGAHPSYPDPINFGRKSILISEGELIQSIQLQIKNLVLIIKAQNCILHHIKPHGALYNDIAKSKQLASVFLKAIEAYKYAAVLYVPFGSVIGSLAVQKGFKICYEAFMDRNYNDDLSLVDRLKPNAIIQNSRAVLNHILPMIKNKIVISNSKKSISFNANTYCIHSDTSNSSSILLYLYNELPKHSISIEKCTNTP